jgi:hypothetical protein
LGWRGQKNITYIQNNRLMLYSVLPDEKSIFKKKEKETQRFKGLKSARQEAFQGRGLQFQIAWSGRPHCEGGIWKDGGGKGAAHDIQGSAFQVTSPREPMQDGDQESFVFFLHVPVGTLHSSQQRTHNVLTGFLLPFFLILLISGDPATDLSPTKHVTSIQ